MQHRQPARHCSRARRYGRNERLFQQASQQFSLISESVTLDMWARSEPLKQCNQAQSDAQVLNMKANDALSVAIRSLPRASSVCWAPCMEHLMAWSHTPGTVTGARPSLLTGCMSPALLQSCASIPAPRTRWRPHQSRSSPAKGREGVSEGPSTEPPPPVFLHLLRGRRPHSLWAQ